MSAAQPLRVLFVAACPFPHGRGSPIRIFQLATALASRGHEVHVATYHLGDGRETAPLHVHRTPRVHWYEKYGPGPTYGKLLVLDPLLIRLLRRVSNRHRFDVVHAHHYEGLIAAFWGLRGAPPLIYDAHTMLESELPYYPLGLPRALIRSCGRMLDRRLPGRAAHVISVSEEIRTALLRLRAVPADRVDVIPNGVEAELFDVDHPRRSKGSVVGFAGNLAPHQGLELLLRSFALVRAGREEARLRIITSSPLAPYDPLAEELGIRGAIELRDGAFGDLPRNLAGCDVLVSPRVDCTGLPMKLLNYMAAGRPIVAFEGSAVHLRHGETGWIVPNGDTAGMADAIARLLDDAELAGRLGAAARREARAEFNWQTRATQVETVYERLLSRTVARGAGETWRAGTGAAAPRIQP